MTEKPKDSESLTVTEFAKRAGVHRNTVLKYIHSGKLRHTWGTPTHFRYLVPISELEKFGKTEALP